MIWDGENQLQVHFLFSGKGITVSVSRPVDEAEWEIIEEAIHQMGCPECLRGDWGEH